MLTHKIDLTEHHDFGGEQQRDILIGAVIDNEFVTCDEWEAIDKYEKLWGRRHRTQRHEVFDKSDEEFMKECRKHCARCGKEFRIPWYNTDGLCRDCDHIVSHEEYNLPWRQGNLRVVRADDRGQGDLFDLR